MSDNTSSVLLYSGGMDSYIAAALLNPDILLHVDTGTHYGDVERSRLTPPSGMSITRASLRDLAAWENPTTKILPGRNLHLVLLGASFANRIWLGATAGDRTCDKDERFARLATDLLQHIYSPQWWLPDGRPVVVELPIKRFTKRQLVRQYIEAGFPASDLAMNTFSCYFPSENGEPCAACKPCARKWVALTAEEVHPGYDASVAAVDFSQGRGTEAQDCRDALAAWAELGAS